MTLTAPAGSAAETQMEALEAKIHLALEKLAKAREENARLKQELAEHERGRQEVRMRMERLLKQFDAVTREN
jgi:predicted  nucleic acid-binding Zn-ribbon protein